MRREILLAALAVALPTITALVGILLGRNDLAVSAHWKTGSTPTWFR